MWGVRRILLCGLVGVALAGCAVSDELPPTPTKTPAPGTQSVTVTPGVVFPSLDVLEQVGLQAGDLEPGFEPDVDFSGALTIDVLSEAASAETVLFLSGLDNVYGYRSASIRTDSLNNLAVVRSWVIVFGDTQQASVFFQLHPTIISNESGFQELGWPPLGDESAAYRALSSDEEVVVLERHDVIIRRQNMVAVIFTVAPVGMTDLDLLDGYARLLDSRLSEAMSNS